MPDGLDYDPNILTDEELEEKMRQDDLDEQARQDALSLTEANSFASVELPNFTVNAGSDFQNFYKDDENYSAFDDLFPHQTDKENEAAAFFNTPYESETGSLNIDPVDNSGSIRYPSNIRDTVSTGRRATDSTLSPNPEGDDSLLMPEIDEALFGDQYEGIVPDLGVAKTRKGFVPTEVVDPDYKKSKPRGRQPGGLRNSIGLTTGLLGIGAATRLGRQRNNENNRDLPIIPIQQRKQTKPEGDPKEPEMKEYKRRDPNDPKSLYQWADDSLEDVEGVIGGIFGAEKKLNPQQIAQMGEDFRGVGEQFMGGYTDMATGIGGADIGLDEQKRQSMGGFFSGGEYGDLLSGMAQGDPGGAQAVSDLRKQSNMLGDATLGVINDAGVLNQRERASIEDQARGGFASRGRAWDNSALAGEMGDVVQAERLDRDRDLSTAASLMGAQSGIAQSTNALQNQFVNQFLGANQSIMPGLGVAEGMKDTASGVGMDAGEHFNLAGLQAQNDLGLEMSREEADAYREAGYANMLGDMGGNAFGSWLDKLMNPGD